MIPIGAGLGGGSSDAAATLLALNRIWKVNFSKSKLLEMAPNLGADVAFFIYGQSAFGEGHRRPTVSDLAATPLVFISDSKFGDLNAGNFPIL